VAARGGEWQTCGDGPGGAATMSDPIREAEKKTSLAVTVITWAAAISVVMVLCVVFYSVWRNLRPY
jgi:hypothetical protein